MKKKWSVGFVWNSSGLLGRNYLVTEELKYSTLPNNCQFLNVVFSNAEPNEYHTACGYNSDAHEFICYIVILIFNCKRRNVMVINGGECLLMWPNPFAASQCNTTTAMADYTPGRKKNNKTNQPPRPPVYCRFPSPLNYYHDVEVSVVCITRASDLHIHSNGRRRPGSVVRKINYGIGFLIRADDKGTKSKQHYPTSQ